MDFTETVAAWLVCAALLLIGIVLDRRPYAPGRRDYVPLMILALTGIMVLTGHLVRLWLSRGGGGSTDGP